MIDFDDLTAWLQPLVDPTFAHSGYEGLTWRGPDFDPVTEQADRVVAISRTGGPGLVTEEAAYDAVTFQIRVRGAQANPADTKAVMGLIDKLLVPPPPNPPVTPVSINGIRCISIDRVGAAPGFLRLDDAYRTEDVGNYVFIAAR